MLCYPAFANIMVKFNFSARRRSGRQRNEPNGKHLSRVVMMSLVDVFYLMHLPNLRSRPRLIDNRLDLTSNLICASLSKKKYEIPR